jgi:hypothetical protein
MIPDPATGQPVQPWQQGRTGATAFTRSEAQRFARQVVESESYRETVKTRAKNGTLAPAVEQMLWYYAYGKPSEHINMTVTPGTEDLAGMSIEQLQERAQELNNQLEEAKALADAIPVDVVQGPWPKP